MQADELIESKVIATQDKEELQLRNSKFIDHLSDVFTALKVENSK